MGVLIFELGTKIKGYTPIRADTQADFLLSSFLGQIGSEISIKYEKEWLHGSEDEFGGYNSIQLQKHEGNIYITLAFDDREFPDECEIPIPTFSKMLDDWSEILKKKPLYVVVIHDGPSITIQGYEKDPSNLIKKFTN